MPNVLDRDGLFFEYPRKAGEAVKRIVFLPFSKTSNSTPSQPNADEMPDQFFSDINITEKKAARLVSYNVINRNNTLFAHTGSTSRALQFKATINGRKLEEVGAFKPNGTSNAASRAKFKFVTLPTNRRKDSYNSLNFIKDILTTCVTTHATNTVLGPPLIRLKYGNLYQHCLFVCNDISMSNKLDQTGFVVDPDDPMDKSKWNFDRKIFKTFDISLNLKEVRSNDGSLFVPNKLVQRDGVAGWESVLDGLGYDPGSLED